ncbi:glycosyltransferase [Nitrososphaeria virus YSH_922147]|uniref:Glycosyltransferase n=1 Tax=Nitrososphaeria virus YSH_922147 TaxID=3071323 RepID=A0A976UBD3_9CAUD|nr:glycosyltransferase [Yangshan Harbor Nitrososphaeria virus]UVF62437.1 glycosyltransferase [Nitrososphaeria virus YSH_922147]
MTLRDSSHHIIIGVGYSYYNDLESIKRGLPTFADNVDFVFAIDGRYSLREGADYSDDGSTEFISKFPNSIIRKFVGMEHDKRNEYVDLAEEMDVDFLIILDSDEFVLEADWEMFRENLYQLRNSNNHIHGIKCYYNSKDFTSYPRIWRVGKVRYYKTHNIFDVNGSLVRSPPNLKTVEGISMGMDDNLRSEQYLQKSSEYQRKMLDYEIPIRHALRDGKPI